MRNLKERLHSAEVVRLLFDAGFDRMGAARWLEVCERTIDRWIASGLVPGPARHALEMRAGRDPDWLGFRFRGPVVIAPNGDQVHKNQIESMEYQLRLAKSIGALEERDLARLLEQAKPTAEVVPLRLVDPVPSSQGGTPEPDLVPMRFALM